MGVKYLIIHIYPHPGLPPFKGKELELHGLIEKLPVFLLFNEDRDDASIVPNQLMRVPALFLLRLLPYRPFFFAGFSFPEFTGDVSVAVSVTVSGC